jgi:pimeloyl-ACP methyl ester carboxylesterase
MTAQTKKFVDVLGRQMAYVDVGSGDPIVFLHGNPTSSYLWRKIIPRCTGLGRCLAPDLIGMGDSDKLQTSGPGSYTLGEHRRYLDAWFEKLGLTKNVTLIVHDWGSVLGFDWARRHPDAVKGIAYMEAIVMPLRWASMPSPDAFRAFRSPAGEKVVLEDNKFIEGVLPAGMIRKLSEEEMAEYRRPFLTPGEDRRPTLTFPRQCRSKAIRPTSRRSSRITALGSARPRRRSCSSTPIPAQRCKTSIVCSAGHGPTRLRLRSPVCISSRKTARTKSVEPLSIGTQVSTRDRVATKRTVASARQPSQLHLSRQPKVMVEDEHIRPF